MKWSLKLGRLWGVDVYLHYTFLVFLALVGLDSRLQTGRWGSAVAGVSMFLGVFVCVLLHEYGHAMAARRYGVATRDITLLPMGGVARLDRIPDAPLQQLVIALAGPLVNVVIAGGLGLGLHLSEEMPVSIRELESAGFFPRLLLINAGLVVFNLLPAFPMDGGRVLRALLALWIDPTRATRISAVVGRVMAVLFIGAAFLMSSPMLGIIGVFVWMEAGGEAISMEMRAAMGDATVRRVMLRRFRVLSPADPLSRVAEWLIEDSQADFPVVAEDGQVMGVLTRNGLLEGLRRGGESTPVEGVVQRDVVLLDPGEALEIAMLRLEESGLPVALVVESGRLVGMLTSENAAEFLALQRALRRERVPPVLVSRPRGVG
jgi:Zn-dependent protease/predicted transcriptional regulator